MKKILILTSYVTGHGHKSITNALEKALDTHSDIEYKSVEAFEFAGKTGVRIGKLYAPIIRTSEDMWKLIYKVSAKGPNAVRRTVRQLMRHKFYKLIDEYKPDLVVSDHPAFVSAVIDLLRMKKLKIPFAVVVADLISLSPLWIDTRTDLLIVPTKEASIYAQKLGMLEKRIRVINLPVRKEIVDVAKGITNIDEEYIKNKKDIKFLVMSGGEGSGDMADIVNKLLKVENAKISVIAGRNKKMKEGLEEEFKDNLDRITVYGFVEDMGSLLKAQDIAIVRGSPNVLMECVSCTLPVVITGTLPGQEEGNIDFILGNNLGVLWHKKNSFSMIIKDLLKDDRKKLIELKKNEFNFRDLSAAEKIADELSNML
ncbi:MAG: glycosyltransferase [Clostridia bacterium]|nr:glycosyltransferase [Clostridia bacterium]